MITLTNYLIESIHDAPARVFIIIKPGFLDISRQIIKRFIDDGWCIEKSKTKKLLLREARQLYKIHKKEDWYKDLCDYMSNGLTTAFILINRNKSMSPKILDEVGEIKDELRKKYGESDMRNVLHSSDTISHMEYEQGIYF